MNCKHVRVEGNTTKYYICGIKKKPLNEYECRDCPLRISSLPTEFEKVFGKGFKK